MANLWNPKTSAGRENLKRLKQLTDSGLSDEEIGKIFGVSKDYVRVLRSRNKIRKDSFRGKKRAQVKTSIKRRGGKVATDPDLDIGTRIKNIVEYEEESEPGIFQLSDSQLLEYRKDPIKFAKDCILWGGKPLIFDDYQIKWITDNSKLKIANKSRRIGLSFASSFKAFHKALFYPNTTELFASVKEDRAKELMDYVYAFADSNPTLFAGIFVERSRLFCLLTTGSRIYSLSNSPAGVRGIPQISGINVHLDEFAHFGSDQDEKIYQALIPSIGLGGTMSIWSTPYGKRGKFYEIWENSHPEAKNHNGYARHEYPWYVCPRISTKDMENIKKAVDPITFEQEFLCKFISTGTELFPHDLVNSCVDNTILEDCATSGNPYYIGIDFGMKSDSSVITVVEVRKEQYVVRHLREFIGRGIEFILPTIKSLNEAFKPVKIFCDETGMGLPLTKALQLELGSRVEGITFTNQRKDSLIMNLWSLFNDGKILIPENVKLKNQLVRMDRGETRGGLPTYSHTSGQHDDYVWSLALACHSDNRRWCGYVDFLPHNSKTTNIFEELKVSVR
jgi:phage FluMu gp28-like protein